MMITRVIIVLVNVSAVMCFVTNLHVRHLAAHSMRLKVPILAMNPSNETSTDNFQDIDDSKVSLHVPAWINNIPSLEKAGYVQTIHSTREFVDFVAAQPDTLCVVKFHANYCKICQKTILKYKKMAVKYSTENSGIRFANVEVTANPKLCSVVGVSRFPFIQIYRNGERVASFGTGPAHNFNKVVGDSIDQMLIHTKEQWEERRRAFDTEINHSIENVRELRSLATMEEECRSAGVNWLGYNIGP